MTTLRFHRLPGDQPCQHPNCRSAPRGPRLACYQVEVGERVKITRVLCCSHGASLAAEHGHPFPPAQGATP